MSRALRLLLGSVAISATAAFFGFGVFVASIMSYAGRPQALFEHSSDAVVVLTGGDLRVREGFKLFTDGAGRRILISGVNRVTTKEDLRRQWQVTPILFNCCVDVGYSALDTVGNAEEARQWLRIWNFHRLVIVTSNYHMPRSLLEFRRALPGIEIVPHAVVATHYQPDQWWRHPGAVKLVVTEYFKYLRSIVRANRSPSQDLSEPEIAPVHNRPDQLSLSPS